MDGEKNDESDVPLCKYGEKCYRKNPEHQKLFRHAKVVVTANKRSVDEHDCGEDATPKDTVYKKTKIDDDVSISNVVSDISADNKSENTQRLITIPLGITVDDRKKLIKELFIFNPPADFFAFWEFCELLNRTDPRNAFKDPFGIILCGPFDLLAGQFDGVHDLTADSFILRHRYFYDLPEFQTVFRVEREDFPPLFHVGYLRDDVDSHSAIVCSNDGDDCALNILGDNLFAALKYTVLRIETDKDAQFKKLMAKLEDHAKKNGFYLEKLSRNVKERNKQTVAKTFHGAGIVVPLNGDVGYRPLGITNDKLKKTASLCSSATDAKVREGSMEKLQELITYVQFANDECDFGMGYELGVDLFCTGYETLHPYVLQLLSVAYTLLHRDNFKLILEAHLRARKTASS